MPDDGIGLIPLVSQSLYEWSGDAREIVTPPTEEPLSLADAKLHLRVIGTDDDDYIAQLIVAARNYVQRAQGRQLVTATLRSYFDGFNSRFIPLWPAKLQSITSISYYDTANALQTVSSALYEHVHANRRGEPGVQPVDTASWPSTYYRPDAVQIVHTCGYGGAADVPPTTVQAIRMAMAYWYGQREAVGAQMAEVPLGVRTLVDMERAQW